MYDPTTLPYLRAAVCFLDDRLSRLLPHELGPIEFAVPEDLLGSLSGRELDTTWIKWIEFPASEPFATVLKMLPSLHAAVKLVRYISTQAARRISRGGPFEAFGLLFDHGFVSQPWLQKGQIRAGHWWNDRVRDENGLDIRDANNNAFMVCRLEAEPYPAKLMNHLTALACEMETIGETRGILRELGINHPSDVDWQSIERNVLPEVETIEVNMVQVQSPRIFDPCVTFPRELPEHLRTFSDAIAAGKTPAQAREIANQRHNKKLTRKSYTDMLRKFTRQTNSQSLQSVA